MLPFFQRELTEKRNWMSEEEMADIFAIAQCTPGVIAVNTATFCGFKTAGVGGAICATLGVLFPPIVIIGLIAAFLGHFAEIVWVQHALVGMRAGVCALVLSGVCKLFHAAVIDVPSGILFAIVLLLSAILGLSPILLVLVSGVIGLVISRLRKDCSI